MFFINTAFALTQPEGTEATALKELGIILGREDGFALDDEPTRVETAVVLLRLMGKEQEALEANRVNSFEDVPNWADAQIAYLYDNGIIRGLSDTQFGTDAVDFNQTMTMILRALGYDDDAGDFVWNSAAEKAVAFSVLTPRCYEEINSSENFTRKNLVSCVFSALQAPFKDGDVTLIEKLLNESAITEDQVRNTGISGLLVAASLLSRESKHVFLHQEFTLDPTGDDAYFFITVNLADSYLNRQKVIEYSFSIPPTKIYSEGGNMYAYFFLYDIKETTVLSITTEVEIYEYDLDTANQYNFPMQLTEEERNLYTSPTTLLESDDPAFTQVDIAENDASELQLIQALLKYTIQHMSIKISYGESSALTALQQGYGDCFEYSAVFAALCRAHDIPARMIICDTIPKANGHAIVEVFVNDLGWIPIDPANTASRAVTMEQLEPDFIYLSDDAHHVGGDYYQAIPVGGTVHVEEKFTER